MQCLHSKTLHQHRASSTCASSAGTSNARNLHALHSSQQRYAQCRGSSVDTTAHVDDNDSLFVSGAADHSHRLMMLTRREVSLAGVASMLGTCLWSTASPAQAAGWVGDCCQWWMPAHSSVHLARHACCFCAFTSRLGAASIICQSVFNLSAACIALLPVAMSTLC